MISAAGLLLALIGAFAAGLSWLVRRTDEQFSSLRREFGVGMDSLRQELSDGLGNVRQDLGGRLTAVERELVEVKIAVARIEGPGRHFVSAR